MWARLHTRHAQKRYTINSAAKPNKTRCKNAKQRQVDLACSISTTQLNSLAFFTLLSSWADRCCCENLFFFSFCVWFSFFESPKKYETHSQWVVCFGNFIESKLISLIYELSATDEFVQSSFATWVVCISAFLQLSLELSCWLKINSYQKTTMEGQLVW